MRAIKIFVDLSFAGLVLLIGVTLVNAISSDVQVLNENTPGCQHGYSNGEIYWSASVTPANGEVSVKVPPNMFLVSSSIEPSRTDRLVNKYLWGIIITYEGTILTYQSDIPVVFTYRLSTSADKFNNFFNII